MLSVERAFAYERWADRRLLEHLTGLEGVPERVWELYAHALAAVDVWVTRLRGEDSSGIELWEASSLDECRRELARVEEMLEDAVKEWGGACLDRVVGYSNQRGIAYETSVRDVLTQLAYHGAYHRGQIAVVLRDAGLEPVNTDYITWVREQTGQSWKP